MRLTAGEGLDNPFGDSFEGTLERRRIDADEFYDTVIPSVATDQDRLVARRAFAGLLWGKQLYRYPVQEWLDGDPAQLKPPPQRRRPEWEGGRNTAWTNVALADVISMPDDWEYPWFASWDLAFHTVTLARIDPAFAKDQLLLMLHDWVQHPSGQLAAYEWAFSDVNPPVHAWAVMLVYISDGSNDQAFLSQAMSKLLLNYAWWVNRKDPAGNDLFGGGFLGMDNISLFDRSKDVPDGWNLEQSDATSWMAFFCLTMLRIAQVLARTRPEWQEVAVTFQERFLAIREAVEAFGSSQHSLWDEQDGFFYDILVNRETQEVVPVRVRSLVGLVPLLAVLNSPPWVNEDLPEFTRRRQWLKKNRPRGYRYLMSESGPDGSLRVTMSLVGPDRFPRLIRYMLSTDEFLSDYGIRSLSATYRDGDTIKLGNRDLYIRYTPGWGDTRMFGGNSNWRGPIWFPLNVLLIDSLRLRAVGVGGDQTVEYPTGSGERRRLDTIAEDLRQRLLSLFRPGIDGRRPGQQRGEGTGDLWQHPTFSEYFHADEGTGLGASHQTGWTALAAYLICANDGVAFDHDTAENRRLANEMVDPADS